MRLSMEFIPLLPEEFYSPPTPWQTLKAAAFPKHGEKYLMENKQEKMDIKTSYPRYLIKTSNKEEEE